MKEKRISLRQSNKGFTLVEICVALIIFAILVSTAAFGLIQWQEYSMMKQQNENAELIYMAAKSKLSSIKANNALDDFLYWTDTENVPSSVINYSGKRVYYATCKKGDYAKYNTINSSNENASLTSDEKKAHVLFDLIAESVYDKSILDACITIEYIEDGTIYAVFYSDRCNGFSYSETSTLVNISQRDTEYLEANTVGSYNALQ